MGNCIRSSRRKQQEKDDDQDRVQEQEWGFAEFGNEGSNGFDQKDGLKVKIILTKEELVWLTIQLKVNEGKKLVELLQEIEREREEQKGKVKAWKPSLESIKESPEGLEM